MFRFISSANAAASKSIGSLSSYTQHPTPDCVQICSSSDDSPSDTSIIAVGLTPALRKAGVKPTAMIDVSDGLSSELLHICTQSGVGCCIYEDKLPIDFEAAALAEEMNLNIVTCALNGGEDYELLFTCSLDDYEKLIPVEDLYIIGHITKPEYGCNLIGRNGEELPLKAQGWNAFQS